MGRKIISKNYCGDQDDYVVEYIVDTDADLEELPEHTGAGSSAISLESGKVMVVNTSGEWVTFGG